MCLVVLLLVAPPAVANSPRLDYPCTPQMAQLAAASDKELSKLFGKKQVGACLCVFEECRSGSATYDFPVQGPKKLALTFTLRRRLGHGSEDGKAAALPPEVSPKAFAAFAERLAAQPLMSPLLASGVAACAVDVRGSDYSPRCTGSAWRVSFTEAEVRDPKKVRDGTGPRRFFKQHHRLPPSALEGDSDFALARAQPEVARFLRGTPDSGPDDLLVDFDNGGPRRLVLKRGVQAGKYGLETSTEAMTVMLLTDKGGWAAETTSVGLVCSGDRDCR